MTLNIGLNLGVNYAMKPKPRGLGFNFPLAFTMCHMYFSMAGCSLVMALVPRMRQLRPNEQLSQYGLPLLCLSFFYVMAISANNVSLINLSLSVNQIIKSCAPLPVIALAYMMQGRVVPWPKLLSVLLLVSGAVMAVPYGHPHITARGLSLAVLSTVSVGVKAVLSSILLDRSDESGLIPVVVAWYDACISGGLLFLACLFTDDIHLMVQYFSSPDQPWEAVPVFVALGTVAFFYNFVALAFIQATSALAIMVAGNLKHVLLIVLPMVMHHESDPNRSYSAYHWLVRGRPAAAAERCQPCTPSSQPPQTAPLDLCPSPHSDRASRSSSSRWPATRGTTSTSRTTRRPRRLPPPEATQPHPHPAEALLVPPRPTRGRH